MALPAAERCSIGHKWDEYPWDEGGRRRGKHDDGGDVRGAERQGERPVRVDNDRGCQVLASSADA